MLGDTSRFSHLYRSEYGEIFVVFLFQAFVDNRGIRRALEVGVMERTQTKKLLVKAGCPLLRLNGVGLSKASCAVEADSWEFAQVEVITVPKSSALCLNQSVQSPTVSPMPGRPVLQSVPSPTA